ncbi:MAG: amidophosphoribosyltransferase [Acidaminococcaceae bacterium]|nr:amidophosphoribosyltransferase [Acidaminococcaceae bacterium]
MDKLKEECGVYGIFDLDGAEVAHSIYYGLIALQHRGQEACGMAVIDTRGPLPNCRYRKDAGLVSEVFHETNLQEMKGNLGIGHVRYSTTGGSRPENAQPFVISYVKGTLALAHNGNLVNTNDLKWELIQNGAVFHTNTDSEVIAFYLAKERVHSQSVEEAVLATARKLSGAYALVIMSPKKLIGIRDPYGLKPLCLGKRGNAFLLASENCALTAAGAEFIRDIEPGEIIVISADGIRSDRSMQQRKCAHCIFEYIYFARLDSCLDGIHVYDARIAAGKLLARTHPVEADLVSGVPESGLPAAKGYADEAGIPFGLVFYKNSYIGRTFIKPTQDERETGVHMKLSVLKAVVAGKRIVLVDDSIVRGTTMKKLVQMLKDAGAKEVHIRISSPPFRFPCYFGTDVPSGRELIANRYSLDEICQMMGADSLGYLKREHLSEIVNGLPVCTGCFDYQYPMEISDPPIDIFLQGSTAIRI